MRTSQELTYKSAVAVTPDDNTDLAVHPIALYVGVAGNVKVQLVGDAAAVVLPLDKGYHRLVVKRVFSTSTTATSIFALT